MTFIRRLYHGLYKAGRVWHYRTISSGTYTGVKPRQLQPVLFKGEGSIHFAGMCFFGWITSPGFYNSYAYIEAREKGSSVVFGDGCYFNNNFQIVASGARILIGDRCRIGLNCSIMSSDFHNLRPEARNIPPFPSGDITIGNDVFIGNNVIILKSVTIGDNAIIAAGSVVSGNIPANAIAAGVPARMLKEI